MLAVFAALLFNLWNLVHAEEAQTEIGGRGGHDTNTRDVVKLMELILRSEMEAFRVALETDIAALKTDLWSKVDRVVQDMRNEMQEVISSNLERAFKKYTSSSSGLPICHDNYDSRGKLRC